MEDGNEVDRVPEEPILRARTECTTGNGDTSFSLRDLHNGQIKGPSESLTTNWTRLEEPSQSVRGRYDFTPAVS